MRYWLASTLILFFVGLGNSQETKQDKNPKGKDTKKPFVVPTEVLGKTFKEWVKDLHARDPNRREEAMKTILAFGPEKSYEAVPEMLKELARFKTVNVDLAVRVNGIVTVSTILRVHQKHDLAVLKEALPVYKMFLHDSQTLMRVRAVQGLPALGPICRELMDDVIKVARDPAAWELRKEGIKTLTIIACDDKGVPSPKVLPELRKALDDPSLQVRLMALKALEAMSHANITKQDEAAILAKLNAHLKVEPEKTGVIWTHVTIMAATKNVSKLHVEPIAAALKQSDSRARMQALAALVAIGPKAKPWALTAVQEAVDDPDASIGVTAIGALLHMHADETIPFLQRLVKDKTANQVIRDAAEDAIDQLKLVKSKNTEK